MKNGVKTLPQFVTQYKKYVYILRHFLHVLR